MRPAKRYRMVFLGVIIILSFSNDPGSNPKKDFLNYSGERITDGLLSEVTVYRDERGMPHIYAESEHDLYFATGYVAAQDRLWQMDLMRRSGAGRLAEIFGKKLAETDKFFRCLDFSTKSKRLLDNCDPAVLQSLNDYTDGVNQFIVDAGKNLPPEFRILNYHPDPWTLTDIVNIIGMIGWNLAEQNLEIELFNMKLLNRLGYSKASSLLPGNPFPEDLIFPDYIPDSNTINEIESFIDISGARDLAFLKGTTASNNWVISGSKSRTGKPILSNDMHLLLNSPGIWMQIHQVVRGKINVTGVMFPGEPFIIAGHNDRIAWGMTNMLVDCIDLYHETINPENQNQYFFNNEWHELDIRVEKIVVRNGDTETVLVRSTHRGPLISGFKDTGGEPVSMKW